MATQTKTPKRNAAPKVEVDRMKIYKYTESLRCDLTPSEVADRADRAAQVLADRDDKEEEFKAASKHQKSIIESLENDLRRLSAEVRTRSTYRTTECERRLLYESGMFEQIRLDTGEVTFSRRMTDAEMQLEFPFEVAADAEPEPEAS